MKSTRHSFGKTAEGRDVTLFRLQNAAGMSVAVLDYGATLQALKTPDRRGKLTDVVLGYDTIAEYEQNDGYFGAVVGRFANRIGGAAFALNGKTYSLYQNDGENTLHGGKRGFDKYVWDAMTEEDRVVLSRCSSDGEEGYPGSLYVKVSYALTEDNRLIISYGAAADEDTVVNLTNHAYWNLAGQGSVLDHELTVYGSRICENDASSLPTGQMLPVAGTPFDFTKAKPIGRDMGAVHPQLAVGHGYDHNYALDDGEQEKPAALLYSPGSGIAMTVSTTCPGMQLYTGNFISPRKGKNGAAYESRCAVCLETQQYPDAPNRPAFPSAVLKKGEKYLHRTTFAFSLQ